MANRANGLMAGLLRGPRGASVAAGPGLAWSQVGRRWLSQTTVSERIPQTMTGRPGMHFDGYSRPAQAIVTYPNVATSVDASTGTGSAQLAYPRAPYRRVPAPLP